ncbi:multidrug effflux MFS transporter [Brachybacterium huguangmaarense]
MTASTDPAPTSTDAPARPTLRITLTLALMAMIAPFSIDTIFPAFTRIGTEFGADEVALQQLVSGYMAAFAVMSIFHGPISDALGRKLVILAGLGIYVLAAIGATLAPSLEVLILMRVLQGASAGAATIVSRVMVRDMFEGRAAQSLMADIMLIFSVAPALAPIAGGWLLLLGDWRCVFAAIGLYAALVIALTLRLPETLPPEDRIPLRVGSILGALAHAARSFTLWRLALAGAFGFATQFVFIASAPILVTDLLKLGEQDFWVLFVPIIIGMMAGSRVVGHARMTRRTLITVGFAAMVAAALVNLVLVTIGPAPQGGLHWSLLFAAIGPMLIALTVAMQFAPVQLEVLDAFPHERGSASSLATFVQLAMNTLLAGVIAPIATTSLTSFALTALGAALIGNLLWLWHARATAVPAGA